MWGREYIFRGGCVIILFICFGGVVVWGIGINFVICVIYLGWVVENDSVVLVYRLVGVGRV